MKKLIRFFSVIVLAIAGAASAQTYDYEFSWHEFDTVEQTLLSGKASNTYGAFICKTQQDVDSLLWHGTETYKAIRARKLAQGQCLIGSAGTKVRLKKVVGWGRLDNLFYCELEVDYFRKNARNVDPRFKYTLKYTGSPFLQEACRTRSLI